jgi:hypothetical protein
VRNYQKVMHNLVCYPELLIVDVFACMFLVGQHMTALFTDTNMLLIV